MLPRVYPPAPLLSPSPHPRILQPSRPNKSECVSDKPISKTEPKSLYPPQPSPGPCHPSSSFTLFLSPTPDSSGLPPPLRCRPHQPQPVNDTPDLWPDLFHLSTSNTLGSFPQFQRDPTTLEQPSKVLKEWMTCWSAGLPAPPGFPQDLHRCTTPPISLSSHSPPYSRTPEGFIGPDIVHTCWKNRHHRSRNSTHQSEKQP